MANHGIKPIATGAACRFLGVSIAAGHVTYSAYAKRYANKI
jgi:hypothetical protein